jgi:thiamine biosynthesis lipoprotein
MQRSTKSNPKPRPKAKNQTASFQFEAIGTVWNIDIHQTKAPLSDLLEIIQEYIDGFDKNYSRFRADSLVTHMSKKADSYKLPSDARPMLDLYHQLYQITDGAMTPLIGQTLSDAGYDAGYSLKPKPLAQPPSWEAVLDYSFPKLKLLCPALLDFGAIGKGYLVDLVANLLKQCDIQNFCVDAGGDMVYQNKTDQPLRVGLEHPDNAGQVIGVAHISNQSLCGSSGNRRAWEAFHHIMDPRTLTSPHHIKAAWVVADTTLLADGLTTALFFVEPEKLKKHYNFEYAIVHEDYSLERSEKFPAEFFVNN